MSDSRPWFKAKTRGWGWGPATTWQGWLSYAAYVVLAVASGLRFPPGEHPAAFAGSLAGLTALLLGVCLLKGEKPGWR